MLPARSANKNRVEGLGGPSKAFEKMFKGLRASLGPLWSPLGTPLGSSWAPFGSSLCPFVLLSGGLGPFLGPFAARPLDFSGGVCWAPAKSQEDAPQKAQETAFEGLLKALKGIH